MKEVQNEKNSVHIDAGFGSRNDWVRGECAKIGGQSGG